MKLKFAFFAFFLLQLSIVSAQDSFRRVVPGTPHFALKSNLLYDATGTINLGFEVKTGRKHTLDVPVNYNPWTFHENRKWKHFLVQPELRYWLCEAFQGHFLGIHGHYGQYNVGNLPFGGNLKDSRYEGWLAGGGFSYGYHRMLSNRWSIEATLGLGYAYLSYDKYPCKKCGELLKSDKKHYLGVTKAAVSLIYIIK
ncbi:DUF3575 domain-containing protein [Bacteroides sp. 224]|uniref:DUF3575 domain-containing protein n=1 Tax=Bacteroides sp. 224 TaxID=2302936 RepID=UPI0013D50551|nr:DUF3575 domain-containing protein [Bacteroides sp. 224]NDV67156.1 DUF3575 domain-containing protein [Bacteroides sp. 224]